MKLEIKHLHYTIGNQTILQNFSFAVRRGQFACIIGKNGTGKTTLLRALAGLNLPCQVNDAKAQRTSVRIFANNTHVNVVRNTWELLPKYVGMVFQHYSTILFEWQTVDKALKWVKTRDEAHYANVYAAFEVLHSLSERYWGTLSGGQKQALALARGLMRDPDVLLLDEPLSSIDPGLRYDLEDVVLKVNLSGKRDRATILVTHDLDQAIYLSDIVYIADGPPLNIQPGAIVIDYPRSERNYTFRSTDIYLKARAQLYERTYGNNQRR